MVKEVILYCTLVHPTTGGSAAQGVGGLHIFSQAVQLKKHTDALTEPGDKLCKFPFSSCEAAAAANTNTNATNTTTTAYNAIPTTFYCSPPSSARFFLDPNRFTAW